jgi:exonuclease SbcC
MKILRIRLNNLNSLKGPHSIDLTEEPLASAGLFAITGPTGAGKSTILDAITLALYGKAARYGSDTNPEDMMSRHCGECSAEVEFEVPSGVYRAVWERHRARSKADGKLQPPKRFIYDSAGEPLTQQIQEAEKKIEELLGLNYERFLRSVLLAQGDFAKFLKAKADERAGLLESLTGTAIYSRLGKLAYDKSIALENALKDRKALLDQIVILDDEVRSQLEADVKQGIDQRKKLSAEIKEGEKMLSKISGMEDARKDEKKAAEELEKIENARKTAQGDLDRLRLHRLTVPFAADLALLDAAETALTTATGDRVKAEKVNDVAKVALVKANQILGASMAAALTKQQGEVKREGDAVTKETKNAADAREWLDKHKHDGGLVGRVGDLAAAIGDLKSKRGSVSLLWSDWKRAAAEILPENRGEFPEYLEAAEDAEIDRILAKFLGVAAKKKDALEADGKDAKKQFDLRQDHLAKAMLVAKLEDHRSNLKEGEPCPLCGAMEHPYAEGAVPNIEIDELQNEVDKASHKLDQARETYRTFDGTLKELNSQRGKLLEGIRECDALEKGLAKLLQPLGVPIPVYGSENELRKALQERESDYQKRQKNEDDAIKRKTDAEKNVVAAAKEVEILAQKLGKLPPLSADLPPGPIDPKDLLPVSEAEENHTEAVSDAKIKAGRLVDLLNDQKKAAEALEKIKRPLEGSVAGSEFKSLEGLHSARLAPDIAEKLEILESGLKNRDTAAGALLKNANERIAGLLVEKVIEGDDAELFKTSQAKLKDDSEQLVVDQTTRQNSIKADDANRGKRMEGEKELEEENKALAVCNRLKELIGSADGSKFRRHAQAISLEILTRHANRHLGKLSDRYQICRDDAEALNLQIEDLHQAGVQRPMASLSGGESFLASLALALGLSDLAGRTVRIDSLFIDEGFGSLDPETLEVAIAALESLRQNRKTVGVISHVSLLKERIGTQIVVEKHAGGVSRIRVMAPN